MACGGQKRGLIAPSDRGTQYTGPAYVDPTLRAGVAPAVGLRREATDNSMSETWVATFKRGGDGHRFPSPEHKTLYRMSFSERLHEERADLALATFEQLLAESSTPGRGQPATTRWETSGALGPRNRPGIKSLIQDLLVNREPARDWLFQSHSFLASEPPFPKPRKQSPIHIGSSCSVGSSRPTISFEY
jgi:hypothetical protein